MYGTAILYECAHCGPLVKLLSLIFWKKQEVIKPKLQSERGHVLLVINSNTTTKYKGESS